MKIEKLKHSLRLMLLLTCLLCSLPSWGKIKITRDGITYEETTTSGELVVVQVNDCQGEIIIPNEVRGPSSWYKVKKIGEHAFSSSKSFSVVISAGIEVIFNNAFSGCSGLTSVTIPNSVTSIGYDAFSGCSGLTSVVIPAKLLSQFNQTFEIYKNLTSVTILDDGTSTPIDDETFKNCSSLTSITIPNSVTSIGYGAFSGCSSLTSITIPNSVTSIGGSAFRECSSLTSITIPNSVTSIGNYTFYSCSSLMSIIIPNNVTSIGTEAFGRCSSLTSITIPNSVTSIGSEAFWCCYNLTSINIPSRVTSIGNLTFSSCGLTSITIPDSVTSIGSDAFYGCHDLTSITIPNNVTYIGPEAFGGCTGLLSAEIPACVMKAGFNSVFRNCENLTTVTFTRNTTLTSICENAFANCSYLTSIKLPSTITTIGDGAFSKCSSLKKITLPPLLDSIGVSAFRGCNSFTTLTIPSKVSTIGNYAFAYCDNLESVKCNSSAEINYTTFEADYKLKKIDGNNVYSDGVAVYNADTTSLIFIIDKTTTQSYTSMPESVTNIGKAFSGCTNFTALKLPTGIKTIDDSAFEGCTNLLNIDFSSSLQVRSIGSSAFKGCSSIVSLKLPENVRNIGMRAFQNCTNLRTIQGANAWYIGDEAFMDCSALDSFSLRAVRTLGDSAFYGCTSLKSICTINYNIIGDNSNMEKIGNSAFEGCCNLSSPVEFNSKELQVGSHAFKGCSQLKELRFGSDNIPWSGTNDDFFAGQTIYVLSGKKYAYKAAIANADVNVVEDYGEADLKALTDKYDEYNGVDWQPLITYSVTPEERSVLSDASQLSANFIEEDEGSLSELLDDDDDTYFLSSWSQDNPTGENHYLQVDMQVKSLGTRLTLKRRTTDDVLAPKTVKIYSTDDLAHDWNEIETYSLDYEDNVASVLLLFDHPMRYLRIEVTETAGNNRENDNLYFALAKLGVNGFRNSYNPQGDGIGIDPKITPYSPIKELVEAEFPKSSSQSVLRTFVSYGYEKSKRPISAQNIVITYQKATEYPTDQQPSSLVLRVNNNYIYDVSDQPSYPYRGGTTGIIAHKGFGYYISNFNFFLSGSGTSGVKKYLKNPHCYDRPCKVDLLSEAEHNELSSIVNSDMRSWKWMRKTDIRYDKVKAYLAQIAYLSTTGRYADFINDNYQTFYADYPAVVPNQVEAGIVKQQGDNLVIDYIYPEGSVIPANTAVILKGDCRGNAYILKEGTTEATAPEDNLLHGTINEEMTNVDGCNRYYKLSYDKATDWTLGFYWGEENAAPFMNRPYKAFLALPESMHAMQMDSFSIADMEQGVNTTSISQASSVSTPTRQGIYSLDGRQVKASDVKQLPAGIYIVNGKKVIVK